MKNLMRNLRNRYYVHILFLVSDADNIFHILNPAKLEVMYLIGVIIRVQKLQAALLQYIAAPRAINQLLDVRGCPII